MDGIQNGARGNDGYHSACCAQVWLSGLLDAAKLTALQDLRHESTNQGLKGQPRPKFSAWPFRSFVLAAMTDVSEGSESRNGCTDSS